MSGDDADEESTEDLWDEVEKFAKADLDDVAGFSEADPEEDPEFVTADPVEAETDVDPAEIGGDFGPIETGTVADTEPTDSPPGENWAADHGSAAVDDELPNTEDVPEAEEVFDEMDMSAVDGEDLWDELAGAETEANSFGGEETASIGAAVEEPIDAEAVEPSVDEGVDRSSGDSDGDGTGGTETLIDKRAYCQQCPYFSAPPEVSCSHDGTEILEVVKDGRFRVRGCPVVTDTGPDRTILNDGS